MSSPWLDGFVCNGVQADNVTRALRASAVSTEGIYPNLVHPDDGKPASKMYSIGAMADSFYEYLLKVGTRPVFSGHWL
jgi:hypothetical protein